MISRASTAAGRARTIVVALLAAASVLSPPASVPLTAQAREGAPGAEVAQAFLATQIRDGWVPPKTPWGDPDLQGTFTTKDESNTPYERPTMFEGRRLTDITQDELAAAIAARQGRVEAIARVQDQGPPEHSGWMDSFTAQNSRAWFVIDPPEGLIPPVTAAARARAAMLTATQIDRNAPGGDSYAVRPLADRCIVNRSPPTSMSPGGYGNSHQILQTPDYVAIRSEMGLPRLIPLSGRPHVGARIRSYFGDSRGHWEGHTLVVETTNIHERVIYRGVSMADVRLIERFTRVAPDRLEWTVTFDAPEAWPRPWTFSIPLTEDDTQPLYEYACHEGNYGLANILSAGRASEREHK